ncbi:transcription initiation factor TFIID subunit 12 [Fusarium oxysporum NRRL 32931]|uniref:Transcription initiation factor TFIID subunit 12 n=1 Tax=Fusarium oxysporum NRRL 32931 TaxID=660029 RepID=W9JCD5_FUSOX|nr:transcription initiation factor TFIID subunit 12 [Fusarium oxysporum NRRL 32931]
MNPQMAQQGQGQGQQAGAGQAQQRPPPMYQPNQIRNLPTLSDEEKSKYEAGLQGLWNKANNSPQNSPDHIAARQKIIEFSKMLITKIQQRRSQQMQGQNAQNQQARPQQMQQNAAGQANQAQPQQQAAGAAAGNQSAAAAAVRRNPVPDHIQQHVNKINFRAPQSVIDKSAAEATKWIEEIKERYTRALMTMDASKQKVAQIDKIINDRAAAGQPFKEDELRQLQLKKDQQLKAHTDAHKWVDSVRKQQGSLQGTGQAQAQAQTQPQAQNSVRLSQPGNQPVQQAAATQQNQPQAQSRPQQQQQQQQQPQATQNQPQAAQQQNAQTNTAPINAAVEVAKQQLAAVSRASPVNGTPGATPAQVRPAQGTPQPGRQQLPAAQVQVKQEPGAAPINPVMASTAAQNQAGTPTQQNAPRIPTPQQAAAASAPVTAAGPQQALSHSAAMDLANQKAINTPGSASVPGRSAATGTPTPGSAVNQGVMGPNVPQQPTPQGHPHAHPPQPQQTPMQSKMPIPKVLPEKATAVPQGVSVGGGVNTGRPTMSQGSGTLGGVMNQPAMARIPAYNHEAEGDHVLSKKKLDELVRQVCGGPAEGQDGNLLTPEVEENVLNMADSFVDSVLHAACRNSKERGSKVLEIRDIQLVLERTYNIRVPGYSSDELRTVRKIQPSTGWIAKMSAVQAAKVMPGKGE